MPSARERRTVVSPAGHWYMDSLPVGGPGRRHDCSTLPGRGIRYAIGKNNNLDYGKGNCPPCAGGNSGSPRQTWCRAFSSSPRNDDPSQLDILIVNAGERDPALSSYHSTGDPAGFLDVYFKTKHTPNVKRKKIVRRPGRPGFCQKIISSTSTTALSILR